LKPVNRPTILGFEGTYHMPRVGSGKYPIVLSTVAILGVAAVATAVILHSMWRNALDDASTATGTVAAIIADQTLQSVQGIDVVLDDFVTHTRLHGIESGEDLRREFDREVQHAALVKRLNRLRHAEVIGVVDSAGDTVVSTRSWPAPANNVAGRDPFEYLRNHRDKDLVVGIPVRNQIDGDWTVYFSRRLENTAGDFLGTVSVGVLPDFFLQIAEGTSSIDGYAARLLREDGTIYVANPPDESLLGAMHGEGSAWHAAVEAGGGTYRAEATPDQPARIIAVRPVADYPLVVDVARTEASVAAVWRARAMPVALISGALALCMAALAGGLILQVQRAFGQQAQLRERDEELLREARQRQVADARFETAIGHMRQGLAVFDKDSRLVTCNRAFLQMYAIAPEEAPPGTPLATILALRIARGVYSGDDPEAYTQERMALGANPDMKERTDVHPMRDGRFFSLSKQNLPDGGWLAVHEDVTERERTLARLRYLASHDALTALGNRSLLFERLEGLPAPVPGTGCAGLLLIDLDGFKTVNDRFGHTVGDALLHAVASRLRSATVESDTLARLGGDEFAVLRPCDTEGVPGLVALGTQLRQALQTPFDIPPHILKIGASIGISAATEERVSTQQMLRRADLALYHAKSQGRNRVAVFESSMEIAISHRRRLARDLDVALDAGGIEVVYQPIVDVDTGRAVAMEALARWNHPDLGAIPPSTFVGVAEEFGLVERLGDAILAEALRTAVGWPATVRIAVNVSPIQITANDLPGVIGRALANTGIAPERVELEITESALLADERHVGECLRALRAMGIQIVLDDFGTGFASLSNLNTFTVDRIKIDRAFVGRLGRHAGSTAIVEASTMIAEAFRVVVTAEGVETEEQRDILRRLGVRHQQGYLFARPAPREAWSFVDGKAVQCATARTTSPA
jgi:diguanylate cyclase (GGDEF)-like protein